MLLYCPNAGVHYQSTFCAEERSRSDGWYCPRYPRRAQAAAKAQSDADKEATAIRCRATALAATREQFAAVVTPDVRTQKQATGED